MTILTVGQGQQYATIAAAVGASKDGDVVQVQAGTYVNDFATVNTKITITAVGGMAHLVATTAPPDGKGILVTNTDVTLDHLELSGAQVPDGNGAGVRYQGGSLVMTNCYVHDNQDGILANPVADGHITIRDSEFAHNGAGDGYTHNIYVGQIASLTIEDSYIHDAVVGHEVKSRAEATTITGSRIIDGPSGSASYSIDLPNGGKALIADNVIEQGPASQNPAIVHFGGEGYDYPGSSLEITGNTVLNELASPSATLLLNHTGVTASIHGNDVWGLSSGQIASGPASIGSITTLASEPLVDLTSPWTTGDTGSGGTGGDTGSGTGGGDALTGNKGDDLFTGDGGDNLLAGYAGADTLTGGGGSDTVTGGQGSDLLSGGDGNDALAGRAGADSLDGAAGNDTISGGSDNDLLTGGASADLFVFHAVSSGADHITDFDPSQGDRLDLSACFAAEYPSDQASLIDGGFLQFTQQADGVLVQVDRNGGGDHFVPAVVLDGQTIAGLGHDVIA